ncbi:dihydrofolate reductase [Microbacterium Phage DirtyBubble]|uniref:dihydrofolate reductase n=1 Tax=Microbacterium Phage DirtyBubble TaxID=2590932 RepID=UPI0011881E11|nr:dihydrofolate reductase [Microbacterium Phage DirtyBubble]QDP45074.1 dihydrofolate reductase [Microbacterium Phage DirtyBubble]
MTTDSIAVWAETNRPSDGQAVMGRTDSPTGLPWSHNAEDLRHFREVTRGRVLIMGHTTFRLLPAILKSRASLAERPMIVLATAHSKIIDDYPGLPVQPIAWADEHRAPELLRDASTWWNDGPRRGVAVIGGRSVIELFAPHLDRLEVTFHSERAEGDVLAPSAATFDGFRRATTTVGETVDFVTFSKE